MPVENDYLTRLKNPAEDPVRVMQEFLDDFGDRDYIDNLGHLCNSGGYPDEDADPEYQVRSAKREENFVKAVCDVFFDEKYFGSGCPDMPSREQISGSVVYEIDLEDGSITTIDAD
jgi:hypothetical protein